MKTALALLFLAAVQLALGAEKLALEVYRLVPAPTSRPEEARLLLKVVNRSDAPLYFESPSPTAPLARVERKKQGAWVADPAFVCAMGLGRHVVLPRSYLVFEEPPVFYSLPSEDDEIGPIKFAPKLPAEPVRIVVTCYEGAALDRPVVAATRDFAPTEFVQK